MNASQIDLRVERPDRGVWDVTGTDDQRVVDFYRSINPPSFGAVVSTC